MKSLPAFPALALAGFLVAPLLAAPVETPRDSGRSEARESPDLEAAGVGWDFEVGVGVDYCSKQLTYGLIDNPHAIVTPGAEISFGHEDFFTLTLTPTVGFGVGNRARNECDFGDWYEENDVRAESFMLRDGYARLELTHAPIEGLEITPYIGCHQQLDSTAKEAVGDDDFVGIAGLSLSYTF